MFQMNDFRLNGFAVLPNAFSVEEVFSFRRTVSENLHLMGQTRELAHSYHLAGFHRFEPYRDLHSAVTSNTAIRQFLNAAILDDDVCEIGLSDITINRSQQWHTDLLRGHYQVHLKDIDPWETAASSCIKALVYLQPGRSLRIIPGAHLNKTPLDDAVIEEMIENDRIKQVNLSSGDVVMMDIRSVHRGSTDQELVSNSQIEDAKILISTVFGATSAPLAHAMRSGNSHRMSDWDERHLLHR